MAEDLQTSDPAIWALISRLDGVAAEDAGGRGMGALRKDGDLQKTASALLLAKSVGIATGYPCCPSNPPTETDGPIGAMAVARVLVQMDKKVVILTDECNRVPVEAAIASSEEAYGCGGNLFCLACFPAGEINATKVAADYALDHVLAIERPGPAVDGGYYTMKGRDMAESVGIARLDMLWHLGISSSAVGDGGNEVGMGSRLSAVHDNIPLGTKIACITPADTLIASGVSNWGGWALAFAMHILQKTSGEDPNLSVARMGILPSVGGELSILRSMVAAGACDGVTGRCEETVDGLPWDVHVRILQQLREAAIDTPM